MMTGKDEEEEEEGKGGKKNRWGSQFWEGF